MRLDSVSAIREITRYQATYLLAKISTRGKANNALKKLYLGSAKTESKGSAGSFLSRERRDLETTGSLEMGLTKEAGRNRSAP